MRAGPAALVALVTLGAAAQPARVPSADVASVAARVVEATNAFRRAHGLPDVESEARLTRAAREFAQYMARTGKYGHEADGREPAQRAEAHHYDYCLVLENIAYHYDSRGFETAALAQRVVEGWKGSPPHRKNMEHPRVVHVGVGVAKAANGYYYAVQMLGLPRSASVTFEVRNESQGAVVYHVGTQAHSIPGRSIRTHQVCSGEAVRFEALPGGEAVVPRRGDRFLIAPPRNRVTLQRAQ